MPLRYINPDANLLRKNLFKMNIATIFKAQTEKKKQKQKQTKTFKGKKTHLHTSV